MTQQIAKRVLKLATPFDLPNTIQECLIMKKEARKALREAEVEEYKTHKLRQEYQLELQVKYEEDGDTFQWQPSSSESVMLKSLDGLGKSVLLPEEWSQWRSQQS
jgi:hypothetical protein